MALLRPPKLASWYAMYAWVAQVSDIFGILPVKYNLFEYSGKWTQSGAPALGSHSLQRVLHTHHASKTTLQSRAYFKDSVHHRMTFKTVCCYVLTIWSLPYVSIQGAWVLHHLAQAKAKLKKRAMERLQGDKQQSLEARKAWQSVQVGSDWNMLKWEPDYRKKRREAWISQSARKRFKSRTCRRNFMVHELGFGIPRSIAKDAPFLCLVLRRVRDRNPFMILPPFLS